MEESPCLRASACPSKPWRRKVAPLALSCALLLLTSCSTPAPSSSDPLTAQFASSARAAYDRGAYPQAARFYELALQRARARDDGPEIARCAYNLAAAQLELGHASDARTSLREALVEFARCRMDSQPALLLDARAAQAAKDPQEAARVLDLAFTSCKSDAQRLQVWLARGELQAAAGDRDAAAKALRAADALGKNLEDPLLEGARLDLTARVASLSGKPPEAAWNFDAAANAWQAAGQLRDMARALGGAGEAFLQAGDARSAADRYYRAARSLHAQGDSVATLKLIEKGLAANAQASDPDLQALLAGLFDTVKQTVEQAKTEPTPE